LGIDWDTQLVEHHAGLIREPFGNNLLFFAAGNESFYRIAEANRHPDDTMGAIVLVKERDGVGSMAPVVDSADILRGLGNGPPGNHCFGHVAGVELYCSDNLVEQIVVSQQSSGRYSVMLVAMPAELFAKPLFVGEAEAGAVGSPKAHALPAFGFEAFVV